MRTVAHKKDELMDYVYIGKPFPENFPHKPELQLKAVRDGIAFPHVFGEEVGENSDKYGKISYFVEDHKAGTTHLLDALIEAGCVREKTRRVLRNKKGTDEYDEVLLTTYTLPYRSKEATFHLPTVNANISMACNVEVDGLIEVKLVTEDGEAERYLHIPIATAGPFSMSFLDYVGDIEEDIRDMVEEGICGFKKSDDCIMATFFDTQTGADCELEFYSISELLHTVVSVRIVKLENRIVDRKINCRRKTDGNENV